MFCGVHFMAETADVLARDEVEVFLPDLAAGCSMADMADLESVEAAWQDLGDIIDTNDITPVTYINSSADLKAFCGRHGGIVCTSSNARAVLEWSFAKRRRVLFFPDQHLGRNTARAMGIPLDQMVVWDPREPLGGNTESRSPPAGSCSGEATARSIRCSNPIMSSNFAHRFPGSKILVHPECMMQVVDTADLVGSTEFIIKTIASAPAGSTWGVGTELHLVNRLAQDNPDKTIHFLSPMVCMCATMYPNRSAPSRLVPGESRPRNAGQPHQGSRRDGSLGTNRTRAHAPGNLTGRSVAQSGLCWLHGCGKRPAVVKYEVVQRSMGWVQLKVGTTTSHRVFNNACADQSSNHDVAVGNRPDRPRQPLEPVCGSGHS